jgi:hypothetical protein
MGQLQRGIQRRGRLRHGVHFARLVTGENVPDFQNVPPVPTHDFYDAA